MLLLAFTIFNQYNNLSLKTLIMLKSADFVGKLIKYIVSEYLIDRFHTLCL